MQPARAGAELDVRAVAVRGLAAVPQTGAAVDALFSFKIGHAIDAVSECLAGTHGYAGLLNALGAELRIAKGDVIGKAGHGLHFAA